MANQYTKVGERLAAIETQLETVIGDLKDIKDGVASMKVRVAAMSSSVSVVIFVAGHFIVKAMG